MICCLISNKLNTFVNWILCNLIRQKFNEFIFRTQISQSIGSDAILCEPDTPIDLQSDSRTLESYLNLIPDGGVVATLPNGDTAVLYVGIIDILQNYRAKKKIEHAMKSIITKGDTVSVHKPDFYSNRFRKFMTNVVFHSEVTANQPKQNMKKYHSMNTVSELLTTVGRKTAKIDWTPPPDYRRAKLCLNLNGEESEDDLVFYDEPIHYSSLDLQRHASDSKLPSNHATLCSPVTQTDL